MARQCYLECMCNDILCAEIVLTVVSECINSICFWSFPALLPAPHAIRPANNKNNSKFTHKLCEYGSKLLKVRLVFTMSMNSNVWQTIKFMILSASSASKSTSLYALSHAAHNKLNRSLICTSGCLSLINAFRWKWQTIKNSLKVPLEIISFFFVFRWQWVNLGNLSVNVFKMRKIIMKIWFAIYSIEYGRSVHSQKGKSRWINTPHIPKYLCERRKKSWISINNCLLGGFMLILFSCSISFFVE